MSLHQTQRDHHHGSKSKVWSLKLKINELKSFIVTGKCRLSVLPFEASWDGGFKVYSLLLGICNTNHGNYIHSIKSVKKFSRSLHLSIFYFNLWLPEFHVELKGFGLNFPWSMSSNLIFSPLTLGPGSGGVMAITLSTTIRITNAITGKKYCFQLLLVNNSHERGKTFSLNLTIVL